MSVMQRLHLHRTCSLSGPEPSRSPQIHLCCLWGPSGRGSGTSACRLCSSKTKAARFGNSNAATSAGSLPVAVPEIVGPRPTQYNSDLAWEVQRLEETFSKTSEDVPVHEASVLGPSWTFESGNLHRFEDYAKASKTVQDVQETNRELSALLQELSGWDAGPELLDLPQPSASASSRSRSKISKPAAKQNKPRIAASQPQLVAAVVETATTTATESAADAGVTRRKFVPGAVAQQGTPAAAFEAKPPLERNPRQIAKQRASRYRRQSATASVSTESKMAEQPPTDNQFPTSNAFYKAIADEHLLSGEQEKTLALRVQEFLALEQLEQKLTTTLGRPPNASDMAAAANLDLYTFKARWDAGKAAKKRMIDCNLRLVIAVAKKEAGVKLSDIGIDNLIAEGIQGLLKSVERFDHTKGFRFSTYAHWWIRQAVQRCIQLESSIVRLPEYVAGDDIKVHRALAKYKEEHGKAPTEKELVKLTALSTARVRAVLEHKHRVNVASLEAGFENENDEREYVAAAETDDPFEEADNQQLRSDLEQLLCHLEPREAMVIKARYGLDSEGQLRTLEEVGVLFNLTRERIRQIENIALKKLRATQGRNALSEHTLEDYKASGRRAGGMRKHS